MRNLSTFYALCNSFILNKTMYDVQSVEIGSPSLLEIDPNRGIYIPTNLEELNHTSHIFIRKHDEKRLDGTYIETKIHANITNVLF